MTGPGACKTYLCLRHNLVGLVAIGMFGVRLTRMIVCTGMAGSCFRFFNEIAMLSVDVSRAFYIHTTLAG
jgi:hypothetical protein